MAHTLRAVFNHFYKKGIVVDILVVADTANAILPRSPTPGATGLLRTQLSSRRSEEGGQFDRVIAWIYIHKDANRHLARICIAHEIYHLVMELNAYIARKRTGWSQIAVDRVLEDRCNHFARLFCGYHDKFNRDDRLREEFVYFPKEMFNEVVTTNSTHSQGDWPLGITLDPAHPFYRATPPAWLDAEPEP